MAPTTTETEEDFYDLLLSDLHDDSRVAVSKGNKDVLVALAELIGTDAQNNPLGIRQAYPGSGIDDRGRVTYPNEGTARAAYREWFNAGPQREVLRWLQHGRNPGELASAFDAIGHGPGTLRNVVAPLPAPIPANAPPGTVNLTQQQLDDLLMNASNAAAAKATEAVLEHLRTAPSAGEGTIGQLDDAVNLQRPTGPLGAVPDPGPSEEPPAPPAE